MSPRNITIALVLSTAASTRLVAQKPTWVDSLLAAANLPVVTVQLREDGVPGNDIQRVLDAMRTKRIPASEAHDVMDEERKAIGERGPVDNFGAFVQSKLDAGLRGRALASAIRAEHAAHGKGRGNMGTAGGAAGGSGNRGRGNANPGAGNATKGGPPANRGKAAADTSRPQGDRGKAAGTPASKAPATKGRPANPGRPNKPNF